MNAQQTLQNQTQKSPNILFLRTLLQSLSQEIVSAEAGKIETCCLPDITDGRTELAHLQKHIEYQGQAATQIPLSMASLESVPLGARSKTLHIARMTLHTLFPTGMAWLNNPRELTGSRATTSNSRAKCGSTPQAGYRTPSRVLSRCVLSYSYVSRGVFKANPGRWVAEQHSCTSQMRAGSETPSKILSWRWNERGWSSCGLGARSTTTNVSGNKAWFIMMAIAEHALSVWGALSLRNHFCTFLALKKGIGVEDMIFFAGSDYHHLLSYRVIDLLVIPNRDFGLLTPKFCSKPTL